MNERPMAAAVPPRFRFRAEVPCGDDAMHPSIRGDPVPTLRAQLSSYEFRAYKKATGFITLRLRTVLLIQTATSFSTSYLHRMTGALALPPKQVCEIDEMAVGAWTSIPYDGRTLSLDVWLGVHTELRECPSCIGRLDLRVCFSIHGAPFEARVRRDVVVRRIRRKGEPR
jgi:hypothetical protein